MKAEGYEKLADVLERAFDQASKGKGRERHANELPFHEQPMQQIARRRGVGFILGQADKKSEEATGLPPGRDIAELLGAIVYLAGAVIFLEGSRVVTSTIGARPAVEWINWSGGVMPTGGTVIVEIETRNGSTCKDYTRNFNWLHRNEMLPGDIVRYRVVE